MPSRPRAYWKGYMRLSLVTIGVEIYSATKSADATALHQLHKPSGKRIRYEKVVPGIGQIEPSDIVKGFEIDDDAYVVLEPEELDEIKLESGRSIELVQFVKREEIDPRYFEKPYYVLPEGDVSTEGLAVICEALRSTGKVALGKLAMRGRENLVAVMPLDRGLLLETLRFSNELRATADYFDEIPHQKLDKEMLSLAVELVRRKIKPFDPQVFKDAYAAALGELVERKRAGRAIVSIGGEERRAPAKVIDLIEALKKSVGLESAQNTKRVPDAAPRGRAQGKARGAQTKAAARRRG